MSPEQAEVEQGGSDNQGAEPSKLPKVAFWLLITALALVFTAWLMLPNKGGDHWFSKGISSYHVQSQLNEVRPEDIDRVLKSYLGVSFWDVPIDEIQGRLTQLDWVVKAEVSRVWPDKLDVQVFEQKPVARWGENGLINHQGQVFFPYSIEGYRDLVVLDGSLDSSQLVLQRWVVINELFQKQNIALVGLAYKPGKVWQIYLASGQSVILEDEQWQRKLRLFFQAYKQLSQDLIKSAETFDLRYSNGFVVGKKTP